MPPSTRSTGASATGWRPHPPAGRCAFDRPALRRPRPMTGTWSSRPRRGDARAVSGRLRGVAPPPARRDLAPADHLAGRPRSGGERLGQHLEGLCRPASRRGRNGRRLRPLSRRGEVGGSPARGEADRRRSPRADRGGGRRAVAIRREHRLGRDDPGRATFAGRSPALAADEPPGSNPGGHRRRAVGQAPRRAGGPRSAAVRAIRLARDRGGGRRRSRGATDRGWSGGSGWPSTRRPRARAPR